jgi:ammonium transporter, Amt family
MDTGDTAWMLVATALVLFMTPGLALFYGGMVRSKNVLGMLMQNFSAMGLMAVLWAIAGFTLAFGAFGDGGVIGSLEFFGMRGVGAEPGLELTIPLVLFCAYQMTFAVITPALITGATADRMRFGAFMTFIAAWLLLVYAPVAHWVFAGGWLASLGALDFAGGAVVHMNAGAAALAVVLLLGKRRGWPQTPMPPHSLPLTLLGTGILWFGWFGFNAGSALAANGVAAQALYNTFIAASAGLLGWTLVERLREGHATTLGAASGAVAGLVAITPCAGFVSGLSPIAIGFIAGVACLLAVRIKFRFGFDDSLDVVAVHLIGGLVGALLLGIFADANVNELGTDGLLNGGGLTLLGAQAIASVVTLAYSFTVSLVIAKVIDVTMGLRVSAEGELEGLDRDQHAESAYGYDDGVSGGVPLPAAPAASASARVEA